MNPVNQTFGFMGGVVELVLAGKAMLPDRDTGEIKEVIWDNHVRITAGRKVTKLRKVEVESLVDLWKKEPDFVKFVKDQC
jgi:hypothetical protein